MDWQSQYPCTYSLFQHILEYQSPTFNPLNPYEMASFLHRYDGYDYLEETLERILNVERINGFEDKCNEVNTYDKLYFFQSEIHFALYLVDKGFSVDFVRDDAFDGASPDLQIRHGQFGHDIYVEVKHISSRDTVHNTMLWGLREALINTTGFVVSVYINPEFGLFWNNPIGEIERSQSAIDQLLEFCHENKRRVGSVLPLRTELFDFEIMIEGDRKPSTLAVVSDRGVHDIDEDTLSRILYNDIEEKVAKYDDFPEEIPFIIALDSHPRWLLPNTVEHVLYGSRMHYVDESRMEYPYSEEIDRRIQNAVQRGWEEVLTDQYIIPHGLTGIPQDKLGYYIVGPKTMNMNGLIFRYHGDRYFYFPNPFVRDEMNFLEMNALLQ